MAESASRDGPTIFIPTKERHLVKDDVVKGVIDRKLSSDYFRGLITRGMGQIEDQLERDSLEPAPALAVGFSLAKKEANKLRLKTGLPEMAEDATTIRLLNGNDFNKYYKIFSGMENPDARAFSDLLSRSVSVMHDKNLPEYFLASNAFHELIHKWFDVDAFVYQRDEAPDKTVSKHRLLMEPRRLGLLVKKVISGGERPAISTGFSGEFINEIANHSLQYKFIQNVLNSDSGVFRQEAERRKFEADNYLRGEGLENIPGQQLAFGIDASSQLLLDADKLYFGNDSQPFFWPSIFFMQLSSDLSKLCSENGGEPLEITLLKAKADPRLQAAAAGAIDARMGNGFYAKLKKTDFNTKNIVSTLFQIQSKLYPEKVRK